MPFLNDITFEKVVEDSVVDINTHALEVVKDAVEEACNVVLKDAINKCPKKTGALAASGKTDVEIHGLVVTGTVTFGDEDAPYALFAHEKIEADIDWTTPGTGPKYLENAAIEKDQEVQKIVGNAMLSLNGNPISSALTRTEHEA